MRIAIIRSVSWTLLNIGAIQVVKYGDSSNWSEWSLGLLTIPVGTINCAVLIHSVYRLQKPSRIRITYSLAGFLNTAYFFISWNKLTVLSGAMTN
ncbi:hypothetical protein [uncultured Fluviicola sp.]|uniref:hypothetical protein n=1 Tax=uncultured Fluviicola sp. TaxID=463303 RepID=UPI0025E1598C|nr:hypothetical protein [uncultured Fluviicola sp.]